MNLVEGPHCVTIDPRIDGDPHALRAKARSLVTRFEKLGRSRDTLMVGVSWLRFPASRAHGHLTADTTNWKTKTKKKKNADPRNRGWD